MSRVQAHHLKLALSLVRSWTVYAFLPVVGLITAPILARALGPEGRGNLAAVLQPMILASALAALGLPTAVTYFLGRGYSRIDVLRHARVVASVTTFVTASILFLYSQPISDATGISRWWIALVWTAFLPSVFIAIRRASFQATLDFATIDLERMASTVLRLVGILALYLLAVITVVPFAVAFMLAGLTASFVLLRPLRAPNDIGNELGRFSRHELIRYSSMASFGTIATAVNSRLDQAVLPVVTSGEQLGYYAVAVAVAEVPTIVTMVIVRNLLAQVSSSANQSNQKATVLLGAAASATACICLAALAPVIVPWFFGEDFRSVIIIAQILLVSVFVAYFCEIISAKLVGSGHPGLGSAGPLAGALATASLIFIISRVGTLDGVGAAQIALAAQLASLLIGCLGLYVVAKRAPTQHADSSTSRREEFRNG